MARALAALAIPSVAISFAWLRLEDPGRAGDALVVACLAVFPALLPNLKLRLATAVVACIVAVWTSLKPEPWELLPFRDERVLGPALADVRRGVADYYGVVLPFAPGSRPEMHALVLLAIFGFLLATGLLVAARRPVAAAAVVVAGVCWPATLVSEASVSIGALALAAALSVPLALRVRSGPTLVVGAAAASLAVGGAVWMSSAAAFPHEAMVDWESWDVQARPSRALGVRFVWDATYDGISFPPTETVVLRVRGTQSAQYWRASTLDLFESDRWIEELYPVVVRDASGPVPLDRLSPRVARDRARWLEQRVEVKALVDDRLVAAGTPTAIDAPSLGTVFVLSGGVLRARHTVEASDGYRIWSYVPDPSPAALNAAPAAYPRATRRYLTVWGETLPVYGDRRHDERVEALMAARNPWLDAYRPLYEQARRLTRHAGTPYAAVLALESWFRRSGGFRYDESPAHSRTTPPLVDFVVSTRAGYCQHFAGAMALMLRLLGIPSRVAVGFTSGKYTDGGWTVTDRNAHAWVETWFPGHGWVPFDPTPGRGTFSGRYSFASRNADAVNALRRGRLEARLESERGRRRVDASSAPRRRGEDAPLLELVLLLVVGAGGTIGLSKLAVRRSRYLRRSPRARAAASRRELEAFVRDQGVSVPRSTTLEDLGRAVAVELGADGGAFAAAAGHARFGPHAEASAAARVARHELRLLLRHIRGELSPWQRLRGFVSLRSLRGVVE
jgi:transglutaminase-like putative cysteine protease